MSKNETNKIKKCWFCHQEFETQAARIKHLLQVHEVSPNNPFLHGYIKYNTEKERGRVKKICF